ncbi:MAG TPA: response regulator [Edaphobacter sp.]|nr:response regulator [Edaphobacter sp.]HMF65387.1 response regulator [Edaphobacter sp.]
MSHESHLILCVDDELVGLRVRKILLERAGYRVLTALNGAAGLEVFSREPVEAVVLDYSMPGMHGGEVAARMRLTKPHIPILLLSAYIGLPTEVTSLVDLYMTKGEGAPILLNKLGSLLHPAIAP